jgi:prepilin-type N-terminal cleavage/methylation domain-containing protein
MRSSKSGFSFIELLLVMGIIAIVSGVSLISLVGRRNTVTLNTTADKIVALLREAQSRSVGQASSTTWGVHFDNTNIAQPFYSLFAGTYSTSSRENVYPLPTNIEFTTVAGGADATFAQISGRSTGVGTVGLYSSNAGGPGITITIDEYGNVSWAATVEEVLIEVGGGPGGGFAP